MRQRFAESDGLRGCQYLMIERCLCHQLVRPRTHIPRIGECRIVNLSRGSSRFRVRASSRSDPFGISVSSRSGDFGISVSSRSGHFGISASRRSSRVRISVSSRSGHFGISASRRSSRVRISVSSRSGHFGIRVSGRSSRFRINVARSIGRIKRLFEGSSCLFSGFARRIGGTATYILTTCLTSFKKYFRVHTFYPMVRTAPLSMQHTCQLVRPSIHYPIFQVIGLVKFATICILEQIPVSQKLIFFYQSSTFSDP